MFRILILILAVAAPTECLADVTLNALFSDGMVLQRGVPIAIFGTGTPGEKVSVTFHDDGQTVSIGADGKWKLSLDPVKATLEPAELVVECEGKSIRIVDVLVGDVWVCSGQSNMGFKLANCVDGESVATAASDTRLRINNYRSAQSRQRGGKRKATNQERTWQQCVGEVASESSGVAYFFGRKLREKHPDVPVGLIVRALSGSPIEAWTPVSVLKQVDFSSKMLKRFHSESDESKSWLAYATAEDEWKRKERKEGRAATGKRPRFSGDRETKALAESYCGENPGKEWRNRIAPIVPYSIAGVIWYQGERNSKSGQASAEAYEELLISLITSWRGAWEQGDFRFLAVQLPQLAKGGPNWTIVQKGQVAAVARVSNADYIDTSDLPDGGLHPKNKRPIGERLAEKATR